MNRRMFMASMFLSIPISTALAQDLSKGSKVTLSFSDGSEIKLSVSSKETLNEWQGAQAAGIYQVVWIEITNSGAIPAEWSPSQLMLLDNKNRRFAFDDVLSQSITAEKLGRDPFAGRELNPGLSKSYGLVFEVPADATGFKLFDASAGYSLALDDDSASAESPKTDNQGAAPVGSVVDTKSFAVEVLGVSFDDDAQLRLSGDLLVMLSVQAISKDAFGFASADDKFLVSASDGREFELSRAKTAIVRMSLGQEMVFYISGMKYPQYLVFPLGLNKAGGNPVKPTGLTLSYWPKNEPGVEYRFSLQH